MRPGERIRSEMESRGWTQRDLANILGRPLPAVNEIIQGKRAVTPEMAVSLAGAFGIEASEWLRLEAEYRLSLIEPRDTVASHRAKLFDIAPVKDMEKRGWVKKTDSALELEAELRRFYGVESFDRPPEIAASFRKTDTTAPMNASQRAWCFRAKQLARAVAVSPFSESAFEKGIGKLRRITGWPTEIPKVSRILAEMGIRFVVVEPLPHTKVDGVAFWLDDSPVIAMSVRFDRIDNFWHVLGHELSHVRHRDDPAIDAEIAGDTISPSHELSEIEKRANEESAATWIESSEMDSFVTRVGPLYSKEKINRFANRIVVHPGIIVGQLQGRDEIGYQAFRDMLVKVREFVVSQAMTDGWGRAFDC